MSYATDRESFIATMTAEGMPLEIARKILRHAQTIQRCAVNECNGVTPYVECPGGQPRYDHDCADCEFIGRVGRDDWYTCRGHASSSLGGSIIARYADAGSDYWSMPIGLTSQTGDERGTTAAGLLAGRVDLDGCLCDRSVNPDLGGHEKVLSASVERARVERLIREWCAKASCPSIHADPSECETGQFVPMFSGDPRGACVKIRVPSGKWDTLGGPECGIAVPTRY